jgi:alpha-glucosidase (family GH31 glycosyl hydrolase)
MHVQAQLIQRETALDVIETFTEFSGRMRPLPDWISSGAIVGTQGGRAFVEDLHAKLTEQHDVPVASYWLQDWVGSRPAPWGMALWWTWEADDEKYPNWPAFVAYMKKEKHVRIMTYLNSYVADPIEKLPAVKRNLFQEIVERNMAVKDAKGDVYISYLTAAMFGT